MDSEVQENNKKWDDTYDDWWDESVNHQGSLGGETELRLLIEEDEKKEN